MAAKTIDIRLEALGEDGFGPVCEIVGRDTRFTAIDPDCLAMGV